MAIILRNNSNRRVMFDLPHEVVCKDKECTCQVVERSSRDHNEETGEVGVRTSVQRVPRGLVLSSRASTSPLPDSIVDVPIIKDLLRAGTLTQVKEEEQPRQRRTSAGSQTPPTSSTPTTGSGS